MTSNSARGTMAGMGNDSITRDVFYPQPPAVVWRALTEPAALSQWLFPTDFVPTVGRAFTFDLEPNPDVGFDGKVRCTVLSCDPPTSLSYSWAAYGTDTVISYRLEPDGAGTMLFFEQSGFDFSRMHASARAGAEATWTRLLGALHGVVGRMASAAD